MPTNNPKVLSGDRITLPAGFREKWDIKEGDLVKAEWNDEPVLTITALNLTAKKLEGAE